MRFSRVILLAACSLSCWAQWRGPLVVGHRGARAARPENTIAAFRHALAAGADVLELDVVLTKDDRLVVNHDLTIPLDLCFIPGEAAPDPPLFVRNLTLAEVKRFDCGSRRNKAFPNQVTVPGERIPTLEEVFEAVAGSRADLMIETKMAQDASPVFVQPRHFARLLHGAIARAGMAERVIIQSFDYRTLAEIHKLDPKIRLCLLNPRKRLDDYVAPARALGATHQLINYTIIQPEDVPRLHAAGLKIFSGTTDDREVWKRLIGMQVDGILTDDPGGLVEMLKSMGLR
ncbi:MAG TPA: glycerophosphodiester phosphodiesterase family protein [Bryobacteraceae bacterium]|nr:glycerophosphodiester phosphodiesterase family protein [Bryobacteraceae bacterium]HOL72792.1 glycerophosphodiester phosphodiesterase family protein [Bryobacteraceae bacterium]